MMPRELTRTERIQKMVKRLRSAISARNDVLFTEFLPLGYQMTTLDSVSPELFEIVLLTKIRTGTLITIYDDLADNPALRDPELLKHLYETALDDCSFCSNHPIACLVKDLWTEVKDAMRTFPHYSSMSRLFDFDVAQFFTANRYSEMISLQPELANQVENRAYVSHNMGLLIAGTIDLMASPGLNFLELGRIRAFLYSAQQIARLSNVFYTFKREIQEGDCTSEVICAGLEQGLLSLSDLKTLDIGSTITSTQSILRSLRDDSNILFGELSSRAPEIGSFNATQYLDGLRGLELLHQTMETKI